MGFYDTIIWEKDDPVVYINAIDERGQRVLRPTIVAMTDDFGRPINKSRWEQQKALENRRIMNRINKFK